MYEMILLDGKTMNLMYAPTHILQRHILDQST